MHSTQALTPKNSLPHSTEPTSFSRFESHTFYSVATCLPATIERTDPRADSVEGPQEERAAQNPATR